MHLIELVNDWAAELTDPEKVLEFHRKKGRDVKSLADAKDPELQHIVQRMVARSFRRQLPKAKTSRSANLASAAAKGRKNWSMKLRNDNRILAAMEMLMKKWGGVSHVSVSTAAKGLPVAAVLASTGTNAAVMGDVAEQARLYAQTLFLAEKYDLTLPASLAKFAGPDDEPDGGDGAIGVSVGR